ncbi:hypothetical protein FACS189487_03130 [Campylobacterota bacterium]|nr:hypothetical protein FACS189487_03130 [Campylobacterota bacterium]
MRSGFSFVTAIMMMLLISVVGMAMLQLSNMSVEQKGQAFMKTQAELLARSATEYAIKDMLFNPGSMPSTQTDLNGGKTIEINASVYNITMEIQFMGAPDTLSANPDDRKYYGTMLVDTTVATTIDGMPIRYVRRTVQRP